METFGSRVYKEVKGRGTMKSEKHKVYKNGRVTKPCHPSHKKSGPGGIRTPGHGIKSPALYLAKLLALKSEIRNLDINVCEFRKSSCTQCGLTNFLKISIEKTIFGKSNKYTYAISHLCHQTAAHRAMPLWQ